MTLRSFTFVLVALSLLAVGSLATACGGDEALTFEEYYTRFDELGDQFDAGLEAAEAANKGDDALKAIQENLANTVALYASFADSVADLKPPDGTKSEHEELVEAMRAFDVALNAYSDDISNVTSIEELEAIATGEGEELGAIMTRAEEACLALEQIAANAGIMLDLNCRDRD